MFLDLLALPVTGPVGGISWIAEKILEQAEPQLNEKENLKKQLLALQLAFDMEEIPEDEFEEQEEELLLAIMALEDQERLEQEEG
ncbi:gas vesicle protein GvpG [Vacuolonema iberomarrocanum]|uniref:gas vesicle protein GvpG n=1 Tax=Vacuolonema iberomarrocanum TaxID=3454632 RepID=UPI001A04912A|nr:gas vesicle protein GvpG [filamentous cyanobacterium LEGE 07170]